MAKKRKPEETRLDEVDRTTFSTFCSAANSLSQLYSQTMHQQRLSFQAGERHGLEKLYNWILRQQEDGSIVATADINAYLQNELDYGTEDSPTAHQSQPMTQFTHSGIPVHSNPFGSTATTGTGHRSSDHQAKNSSVFSNALSSPVRRSLQHCQLAQGGSYSPNNPILSGNAPRNNETHQSNRDSNLPSFNDSSMDMHSDSSGHDLPY